MFLKYFNLKIFKKALHRRRSRIQRSQRQTETETSNPLYEGGGRGRTYYTSSSVEENDVSFVLLS